MLSLRKQHETSDWFHKFHKGFRLCLRLSLSSQDLVKDSDINREREVSVWEAAIESSRSGG